MFNEFFLFLLEEMKMAWGLFYNQKVGNSLDDAFKDLVL